LRMWMVNPKHMCRQHLLGEHRECHNFFGTLCRHISIKGYLDKGELDPRLLIERHDELVREMLRRGWNHYSPIDTVDYSYVQLPDHCCIDKDKSRDLLFSRCERCREQRKKYE
jgi:hypothetical protein